VLPRTDPAPVTLHLAGTVRPIGDERPASLAQLTVQVNRHANFTTRGLARCPVRKLRGTSTRQALVNCAQALVGTGLFRSHIDIPEQAPFPTIGRVLAFNTSKDGDPAVALHIFGRSPAPISTVLLAALDPTGPPAGVFGPTITVKMPRIGDDWGYVTGFDLTLHRRYRYRGREMSVLSASCPAPAGFDRVPFKAARGTFELADGQTLTRTLSGSCRASD
jgi:hypothetical protein